MHRQIQELKLGANVERRRREPSRGAKESRVWGGSVPLPIGGGGTFLDLKVIMAYFRALCAKFRFFSMTVTV